MKSHSSLVKMATAVMCQVKARVWREGGGEGMEKGRREEGGGRTEVFFSWPEGGRHDHGHSSVLYEQN